MDDMDNDSDDSRKPPAQPQKPKNAKKVPSHQWRTRPFEDRIAMLLKFHKDKGHIQVPQAFKDPESGYSLGAWVGDVRRGRIKLADDERDALNALGFVWTLPGQRSFEDKVAMLVKHKEKHGHMQVPCHYKDPESGYGIGYWVQEVRNKRAPVSDEQRSVLDEIGFCWVIQQRTFDKNYAALLKFKQKHGHIKVPCLYRDPDTDLRLGQWIIEIRRGRNKPSKEHMQKLVDLGFVWAVHNSFDENLALLRQYHAREGSVQKMPSRYRDPDTNAPLGQWLSNISRGRTSVNSEQKRALEELGFLWDVPQRSFEESFAVLKKFHKENGHVKVPCEFCDPDSGLELGQWVADVRRGRIKITEDQRRSLSELNFVWSVLFESNLLLLKKYHKEKGHAQVPHLYKDPDSGFALGQWVADIRNGTIQLTNDHRLCLDELGFVWQVEKTLEEKLDILRKYRKEKKHVDVPCEYHDPDTGFALGRFVDDVRRGRTKLADDQRQMLCELGFVWVAHHKTFEDRVAILVKYKREKGHVQVPQKYKDEESGFCLGQWVSDIRNGRVTISKDQRLVLDEIPFVWASKRRTFQENLELLAKYKAEKGHVQVPSKYKDPVTKFGLGQWVFDIRRGRIQTSDDQKRALDALEFVWVLGHEVFQHNLEMLRKYKERNGHICVPIHYKDPESGFRLGQWVGEIRRSRVRITEEHRATLNQMGFVWVVRQKTFEDKFAVLVKFHKEHGHADVPSKFKDSSGFALGQWVMDVRRGRSCKISDEDRRRFDELGFLWPEQLKQRKEFEEYFGMLVKYQKRNGHAVVPSTYKDADSGFALGKWMYDLWHGHQTVTDAQKQRLGEIGAASLLSFATDQSAAASAKAAAQTATAQTATTTATAQRRDNDPDDSRGNGVKHQRTTGSGNKRTTAASSQRKGCPPPKKRKPSPS